MVQDAYWKYVQKSTMTSEDSVEDIRYSPPGQYLWTPYCSTLILCFCSHSVADGISSLISQSINVIHKFFRLVYAHIVLWTTDFFHKLCHEVDHLHHELEHFLHHLEDDIHYHAKELAAQIRCKLEDLKKCAAHYIEGLDSKGLKKVLIQKCQELHEDLNNFLIAESIEIIYDFFCNVYTDIVWWTNNFYRKFCHKVDHLKHNLEHFLLYLEADLHYHAKELAAQTRSKLEELKECTAHYTEALDPKGLKIALLEKTQELHEHFFCCQPKARTWSQS
ncbi:hypothetical protein GOODEAATRI_025446 [Goodea atripinnis]|uniref:Uncharacterized protein n=1 Tax=Goodea atripinnis TaxID=208336 RepID=A0ABV0NN83_9TELE